VFCYQRFKSVVHWDAVTIKFFFEFRSISFLLCYASDVLWLWSFWFLLCYPVIFPDFVTLWFFLTLLPCDFSWLCYPVIFTDCYPVILTDLFCFSNFCSYIRLFQYSQFFFLALLFWIRCFISSWKILSNGSIEVNFLLLLLIITSKKWSS
jgi:hypothetical protein